MGHLEYLITSFAVVGLAVSAVIAYLKVNRIWARKHISEVSESVSVAAALLSLFTTIPFLLKFIVIDKDYVAAAKFVLSLLVFLVFFLVVLFMVRVVLWDRENPKKLFLLVASYYFYMCWDWRFAGLILVITLVNFVTGPRIKAATTLAGKRFWLAVSLLVSLGILAYFKYANFFIESANQLVTALGFSGDELFAFFCLLALPFLVFFTSAVFLPFTFFLLFLLGFFLSFFLVLPFPDFLPFFTAMA